MTRLAADLVHALGLVVRADADGITEIHEESPELLAELRGRGLVARHPTGRHVATEAGRAAYAAQAIRPTAVSPPAGIGLIFGQAIQRQKGERR